MKETFPISAPEPMKFKVGDEVELMIRDENLSSRFSLGDKAKVFRVYHPTRMYDICKYPEGDCAWVHEYQIKLVKNKQMKYNKLMTDAVLKTATKMMTPNNTVTTLEIKLELIKTHPHLYWTQVTVSDIMMDYADNKNKFLYTDNGTYRVYSLPQKQHKVLVGRATKKTKVAKGRSKAIVKVVPATAKYPTIKSTKAGKMMENNKGHFFTASFITKKDGTLRTINCQYMSSKTDSILVKETSKLKGGVNPVRTITLDNLKELKIGGVTYKVRK